MYIPFPKSLCTVAMNLRLSLHRARHLSPTANVTFCLSSTLGSEAHIVEFTIGDVGKVGFDAVVLRGLNLGLFMLIHSLYLKTDVHFKDTVYL